MEDFCQSCGLPFDEGHAALRAKNADGTNADYCVYCYKDGEFLNPDLTIDEVVGIGVPHLAAKIGEDAARAQLTAWVPTLARWRR